MFIFEFVFKKKKIWEKFYNFFELLVNKYRFFDVIWNEIRYFILSWINVVFLSN